MERLVWFVLRDGRSLVAACDATTTRESLTLALTDPRTTLTLFSNNLTEHIPAHEVRDFVIFESKSPLRAATAIYRFVHV